MRLLRRCTCKRLRHLAVNGKHVGSCPRMSRRQRRELDARNHARTAADLDRYRQWHWSRCDCHDSWDQCPCAEAGHPADGSCGCCDLGTGLCGPKPTAVVAS